jgi:hypothetical protein
MKSTLPCKVAKSGALLPPQISSTQASTFTLRGGPPQIAIANHRLCTRSMGGSRLRIRSIRRPKGGMICLRYFTNVCTQRIHKHMSEQMPGIPEEAPAKPLPTFKEFLETSPPDIEVIVSHRASGPYKSGGFPQSSFFRLNKPELDLHCETCDGIRTFHCADEYGGVLRDTLNFDELHYECKNCKDGNKFKKRFSLAMVGSGRDGLVRKIGEYPAYSPVVSKKVFDLIGQDHHDMFLQGRRAELRGLGIGAFAYYRRIVEDQKVVIIEQLEKVAKRLRAPDEYLLLFAKAKTQTEFTRAIKEIKDAFPPALFIAEQNPLKLLHDLLSDGLHELSDEECLGHARAVRTLLIALADRISEISRDEAKIRESLGAFLSRKQKNPPSK